MSTLRLKMSTIRLLFLVVIFILAILFNICDAARRTPSPKYPAILIFGDSTVDAGNNNYLATVFRADFLPYGRYYPGHIPTGRFSDGKISPDLLASALGIKEVVPPFLNRSLSDQELLTGVSFASAGAGYDQVTNFAANILSMSKQVDLFNNYTARLNGIVGEANAKRIINGALVVIAAGTNDVLLKMTDNAYQDILLGLTQNIVEELYDLGCRFVVVSSLPPLGCTPLEMNINFANSSGQRCLDWQNSYCRSYNQKLAKMLPQIQARLSGSKIAYADIYEPTMDMISQPQKYGFVETKTGCCGTGRLEMGPFCNPLSPTCGNASQFIFFDSVHPTQAAYQVVTDYMVKNVLPLLL